jgi:hypothetical protein
MTFEQELLASSSSSSYVSPRGIQEDHESSSQQPSPRSMQLEVRYCVEKNPALDRTLSQLNPV